MANPFDDDADAGILYNKKGNVPVSPEEDYNFYERQIEDILQNTLESSKQSVIMLEDSEQIGTATALDLVAQGEKLRKVDRQLDEINDTTKQTQKHLNNVKSIFGGIKNYFIKTPAPTTKKTVESTDPSKLENTITKLSSSDSAGFNESDSKSSAMMKSPSSSHTLNDSSRAAIAGSRWEAMDNQIDENLDVMSANLRRLRELGSALGGEIEDQNRLLDKIAVKADKTDTEIRHQDKQMKRILGPGKSKPSQPAPSDDKSGVRSSVVGKK